MPFLQEASDKALDLPRLWPPAQSSLLRAWGPVLPLRDPLSWASCTFCSKSDTQVRHTVHNCSSSSPAFSGWMPVL